MVKTLDGKLDGNELEVEDAFKYLGVWFDIWLWGNVQLVKVTE